MLTQRFREEQNADVHLETSRVYPHLELVRLFGYRDEHIHLPTSSSISVNLKERERGDWRHGRCHVDATVAVSDKFVRDRLWINGEEVSVDKSTSRLAKTLQDARAGAQRFSMLKCHVAVAHELPRGCGLGIEDLMYTGILMAARRLMRSREDEPLAGGEAVGGVPAVGASVGGTQMRAQRILNGGAVRSLVGGIVRLSRGYREDGKDCVPAPIFDELHWPELVVIAVVLRGANEPTRVDYESVMRRGVATSALLAHRAGVLANVRVREVETALGMRDFSRLGAAVIADSNQCAACAMDTSPPTMYLDTTSQKIIATVERMNQGMERVAAAYTFGAGPGPLLLTTETDLPALLWRLLYHFPPDTSTEMNDYCGDREVVMKAMEAPMAAMGSSHGVAAEAGADDALRVAIRDMRPPPEVFPKVFEFKKKLEAATRYGDVPPDSEWDRDGGIGNKPRGLTLGAAPVGILEAQEGNGVMRWPGVIESLVLASPGSGSEMLAHPGAHHLGAKTGLPGMRAEQMRRKTAMLEGERRAAVAAASALGHAFESEPLPLYAAPGSVASLPSASGGFGVGSGLAPDGGSAVTDNGRIGDGGGLTAQDALTAELPPDAPPPEWIDSVASRNILTIGGIEATSSSVAATARQEFGALTVVDPSPATGMASVMAPNQGGHWAPAPMAAVAHRGRSVADVLMGDPAFSMLCAAFASTGFLEDLRGIDGTEFTVFAPTNAAILDECKALGITEEEFITSPDLHHVVRSHVVMGKKPWSSFHGQHSVATTSGAEFSLGGQNGFGHGAYTVGDAAVLALDMPAANGVVHVLSRVLGNLGVVTRFRRPGGRETTRSDS